MHGFEAHHPIKQQGTAAYGHQACHRIPDQKEIEQVIGKMLGRAPPRPAIRA
jgi:hypothetical protein